MKEDDPILLIPDLAPHVDRDYRDRTRANAIEREELDPVLISAPPAEGSERSTLMEQALYLLNERYGIDADDWISADIQIVPATRPRDVGLKCLDGFRHGDDCGLATLGGAIGLGRRVGGVAGSFRDARRRGVELDHSRRGFHYPCALNLRAAHDTTDISFQGVVDAHGLVHNLAQDAGRLSHPLRAGLFGCFSGHFRFLRELRRAPFLAPPRLCAAPALR